MKFQNGWKAITLISFYLEFKYTSSPYYGNLRYTAVSYILAIMCLPMYNCFCSQANIDYISI